MDTGIYVLLSIWSIGIMYFIYWKLQMNHYEQQMKEVLNDAVELKLNEVVTPHVEKYLQTNIEEYLVESKVVDKFVLFRWARKDGKSN